MISRRNFIGSSAVAAFSTLLVHRSIASPLVPPINREPEQVALVGVVQGLGERKTKAGKLYCFVRMADPRGSFDIIVYSKHMIMDRDSLVPGNMLKISVVNRQHDDGEFYIVATEIVCLSSPSVARKQVVPI